MCFNCLFTFNRSIALISLVIVCCFTGAYHCNDLEEDYFPDPGRKCGKVPIDNFGATNQIWPAGFVCGDDTFITNTPRPTVGPEVTDPPDPEERKSSGKKDPTSGHHRHRHRHPHRLNQKHKHLNHHNRTKHSKEEKNLTTKRPSKLVDRKKRMAYGTSSLPGSFPSYVHIIKKVDDKVFECGGVVMSKTTILTTATCLISDGSGVDWRRRLNDIVLVFAATRRKVDDVMKGDDPKPNIKIWRACAHTRSLATHGWMSGQLDLALLILNDRIKLADDIQPACLPSLAKQKSNYQPVYYVAELGYKNETHLTRNLRFMKAEKTRCPWMDEKAKPYRTLCVKGTDGNPCGMQGSPLYTREISFKTKQLGPMRLNGLLTMSQDPNSCNSTRMGVLKATDLRYMYTYDLLIELWSKCPRNPGAGPNWGGQFNDTLTWGSSEW